MRSLPSGGLYHPDTYRDNCGFGLMAHMKGEASHDLLASAIGALTCMTHRGAILADGKTGDGCGLLLKMPETFFRTVAAEAFGKPVDDLFAVGQVFLSKDASLAARGREAVNAQLAAAGLVLAGWRTVPVDESVCGPIALASVPHIEQVFVNAGGLERNEFQRKLFFVRRLAEQTMADDPDFYITTLSHSVISYKGLVMPADLPRFYKDLSDPRMETAICVFHQRFSTNTAPRWRLAHPFRYMAHNGEINTITGNRNWSLARTPKFATSLLPGLDKLSPLVNRTGSDSSSLDNMLEVLLMGGMDIFRAARMLVPPAWQNVENMDPDLRAFYEFNSMHMEPWDGPAGIVMTDGRHAICTLDRNGLRPARWVMTKNGYITLASEMGVYRHNVEDVVAKGRVGPGQILVIDTQTGDVLKTEDIDNLLKHRQPYKQWLKAHATRLQDTLQAEAANAPMDAEQIKIYQKLFQVTFEERDQVLRPMGETAQEAVGSMGDDTPMAVLSGKIRPVYDYFRQLFAQVTNPPIDPLREAIVMSLETCIGAERNVFEESADHADRVILTSPILSAGKFAQLMALNRPGFFAEVLDLNYDEATGLKQAIINLADRAEAAVRSGKTILVLSDRAIAKGKLPIHAAMAVGAVHYRLTMKGLRCDSNLVVETATARDAHHFAVLIGFGATAVFPYLSYEALTDLVRSGEMLMDPADAHKNYRKAIDKGLLKILSKMGISTVASYRGAQLFEAVGISEEVADICFNDVDSRIQGATFADFEGDLRALAERAWTARKPLEAGGVLKFVHGGEYHAFNPDVVHALQKAVRSGDYADYREYAELVQGRPVAMLRDLFKVKPGGAPVAIDEVESLESILPRFDSAGMSLGALSPEAHEAIATAMNRLGGRSNSGEGGEDPARYGTEKVSKIKQVASGRFGVTPAYLVNAEVLQIKVAQGAKPGEGGQLPGGKVNPLIARLRYSVPGVTLISPPPHHDIYSIEDLAQLIFDLKQVNPEALVSVKLVSEPGVGTIAAGVAKAYADLITISGYDGGTAASPLTSIKYAGSPWELGLSEAQQALRSNDLRHKVRVQTDGGLKTGLDVIKAAMLGAESFGFGTIPMISLGCKFLRICHLNNCATGVATQQDTLRKEHFHGEAEHVMNFFKFVAQDVREWLAHLGFKRLEDVVGRSDLLDVIEGLTERQRNLNLEPMLSNRFVPADKAQHSAGIRNAPFDQGLLNAAIIEATLPAVEKREGGRWEFSITNCDRSVGARLSGEIAKRYGDLAYEKHPIELLFKGTAGQSFGVWNAGGVHLTLEGDANDYVGKGMAGGKLVVRLPQGASYPSQETPIIGNTCLYGATGGRLFAAGRAGERFAVRNSGSHAVVEGAGDHCCEYMTGGLVTVLGATGNNFGAGMTGGFAYVLDVNKDFVDRYNHELVEIHRINSEGMESYRNHVHGVVTEFVAETGSAWGQQILDNFEDYIGQFWLVKPKAASLAGLMNNIRKRHE